MEYMILCDNRTPSQSGILAGICKGICLRNSENTLAVTYSYCVGGCGVFGEIENPEKARDFFFKVFHELRRKGIESFEFSTEDDKLRVDLLSLFRDRKIESEVEYTYQLEDAVWKEASLSTDYEIRKVDNELINHLHNANSLNQTMLLKRLEESWGSLEIFIEQSAGYIAICDNTLIGVIMGSGRYEKYLAIDIEVMPEYRQRGIAKALSKAFIAECLQKGLVPHWDCVESNTASINLAKSLGFKLIKKRPYYWFPIN